MMETLMVASTLENLPDDDEIVLENLRKKYGYKLLGKYTLENTTDFQSEQDSDLEISSNDEENDYKLNDSGNPDGKCNFFWSDSRDEETPTLFTKGKAIFGFMLALTDFSSDILVGINLYLACHYKFAIISFLLTAMPSIVVFSFSIVICLCNYGGDQIVLQVRRNGLSQSDLIGLILCFPLYNSYIGAYDILLIFVLPICIFNKFIYLIILLQQFEKSLDRAIVDCVNT